MICSFNPWLSDLIRVNEAFPLPAQTSVPIPPKCLLPATVGAISRRHCGVDQNILSRFSTTVYNDDILVSRIIQNIPNVAAGVARAWLNYLERLVINVDERIQGEVFVRGVGQTNEVTK